MRGERIQIPQLADHQRPASETPFKWRLAGGLMMAQQASWLGSFVIFRGILTSIAKGPYLLFNFYRGVQTPCPPSGYAHVLALYRDT